MGTPANTNEFLDLVRKSEVTDDKRLDAHIQKLKESGLLPPEPIKVAGILIRDGFLTKFQAENIMHGKWRRFTIGKYKVLEKIGSGGMGNVFLCEHKLMRRRVAIKVLPTAKAADDASRERFYREARVVAALDHPNIVHAYDIDQDDNLHFIVMEYVDGSNLQDIVKKTGPMDVTRACHYIRQATLGLDHAHVQANIVHRDIKPGNILVERTGVVKILDMGLARFFNDEDDMLTKKFDGNNMGTLDYQAPEQAVDSHAVDIRADIYSLGATFYYLLTGRTLFDEGTMAQKAMWHQTRQPKPVSEYRQDIPPGIQDILDRMLAKEPDQRFANPAEVAEALEPFTQTPIEPPLESEMPQLSAAASGAGPQNSGSASIISGPRSGRPGSGPPKAAPTPRSGQAAAVLTPNAKTLGTPVPHRPAARPAMFEEADKGPWNKLTHDTPDHSFQSNTPPETVRPSGLIERAELARSKEIRRLWMVVIALAVLLVAAVAALLVKFVFNQPTDAGTRHAALTVSKDGSKGFKSISQALRSAKPGDVIEIFDAVHEENLVVDARGADVTLQAAPGLDVRWIPDQKKKDERAPLIHISKAPGFHIKGKGITLDGTLDNDRRTRDLMLITSTSPGLTIEDLQFVNVGQNAVKIMNAQGSKEQPIRLLGLSAAKGEAGIAFDANPDVMPPINDYIEINQFRGVEDPIKMKDASVVGAGVKLPK